MAESNWAISGDYFETCNCDYLCPCIVTHMTARPTTGDCKVAIVFRINEGHFGDLSLDGVSFVVAAYTPGPMADGDWTVGLIIDESASEAQREAVGTIASGQAGGPMAHAAPLIGTFAGIETAPIKIESSGMAFKVTAPGFLDIGANGTPSAENPDEPMIIDNTAHPANKRLALAQATHSHMHVFGIDWDDTSGKNNGHFAPFAWQAA